MKVWNVLLMTLMIACASPEQEPNSIRDTMLRASANARQCYLESDTYTKKEMITLKHQHTILSDGSTKDHKILEQNIKDPNFSSCFLTQMKTLKYQLPIELPEKGKDGENTIVLEPSGGMVVTQRFNFYPKADQ